MKKPTVPMRELGARISSAPDSVDVLIAIDSIADIDHIAPAMAQAGGVRVARVAANDLQELALAPGVKAIHGSRPVKALMNNSRALADVDRVNCGEGLPMPYDGTGITIGIVDLGFEPNHAAFRTADGSGSRVKCYMEFIAEEGNGRNMTAYTPEEIAALTTDNPQEFHGTHTSSIAAGSLAGEPYQGVAPNANLVMAAVNLNLASEASLLVGIQKVAEYMTLLRKPGVMNLSIGSNSSPHDATNPAAQFIDAIAQKVPFCISAGNDGRFNRTVRMDFTEEEQEKWVLSYSGENNEYVTFWSQDNQPFGLELYIYPRDIENVLYGPLLEIPGNMHGDAINLTTYPDTEEYSELLAKYWAAAELAASSDVYQANGKYYTEISLIYDRLPELGSKRICLAYKITAAPGTHIDGYAEGDDVFYRPSTDWIKPWEEPMADGSINTLVLGPNVLSIGATDSQGDIAYYSSWGTYQLEGATLPVVSAQGTDVTAALSHYPIDRGINVGEYFAIDVDGKSSYYGPQTGTSMSSPLVAGVIALWLQANPELSVKAVRRIIEETSVKNEYIQASDVPERWGVGVIDAYAGMKKVLADMGGVAAVGVDSPQPLVKVAGGLIEITTVGNAPFHATLSDLRGRTVREGQSSISVSGISAGIYVLSVRTANAVVSYKLKL